VFEIFGVRDISFRRSMTMDKWEVLKVVKLTVKIEKKKEKWQSKKHKNKFR
jgi:hypothetical protein